MIIELLDREGLTLEVRQARLSDLQSVVAIEEDVHHDPMSQALFERELTVDVSQFWVVTHEARVVAYVVFWLVADEVEIHNIATALRMQRRAIARALLQEVMQWSRSQGASSMFLEVREQNVAAQKLYAGLGFDVRGRRRGYYKNPREDGLVLGCAL